MNASYQVLVSRMTTIRTVIDLGRYVEITPLADNVGVGVEAEFFDRKGKRLVGKVIDVSKDVQEGKFPDVKGLVVDTVVR
jgi:hypothetical protein